MKEIIALLILLIFFITLQSCTPEIVPETPLNNPDLVRRLNSGIGQGYPDHFKMIHHANLELAGKNYVLNGYLKIDKTMNTIVLNAQSEFGGTMFTIKISKNQKPEIDVLIKSFKKEWLEKTVALDLEHIYLSGVFSEPSLSSDDAGNLILSETHKNEIRKEKRFSRIPNTETFQLNSYKILKKNKSFYTINYHYSDISKNRFPESIILVNKKMHYSLKLKIAYIM